MATDHHPARAPRMTAVERTATASAEAIAQRAKAAFHTASKAVPTGRQGDDVRCQVLRRLRVLLQGARDEVQRANALDVSSAAKAGLSASLVSRLDLFAKAGKWEAMLEGIDQVADLPSPLEQCTRATRLADGGGAASSSSSKAAPSHAPLDLYRITCPIGVLLCIFESRPEVVVNIACLSIKSGNAAILKGGKESTNSASVLSRLLRQALDESSALPGDLIQTVETRHDVAALLTLDEHIDLVIPRGSNELVRSIQRQSSIPVMGHADGLCVAYVHEDADAALTVPCLVDSKTDYPAACNAIETVLVHKSHMQPDGLVADIVRAFLHAGVTVHADDTCVEAVQAAAATRPLGTENNAKLVSALTADFDTEYLSMDVAVKVVDSLEDAIAHTNTHGSHHTDVIFTTPLAEAESAAATGGHVSESAAAAFVRSVDSANVFVNASTRFCDGFRYGFGTEVGISTGKMHARGPVGLEGLVTYKYVLQGYGGAAAAPAKTTPSPQLCQDFSGPNARAWTHTDLPKRYPPL